MYFKVEFYLMFFLRYFDRGGKLFVGGLGIIERWWREWYFL